MIRIRAMLEMFSKGTDKVKKDVSDINQQLDQAADNSERMARSQNMSSREYRGARGVTGARAAEGRNFSGIASLARQDTGGFVAAYATLAANIFAVTAAFQALSNAARTEQLTRGLELMGARGGTSLTVLANRFREVTDNAISTADAMRSVAQASSAGIGADDIERIGNVARGASLALGRDMSDSIDRLTRGIVKVEPELLDELGIMVRLDEAVREYAKANNLTASSLTNTQRRQAFMNAVLEEGERKFGAINDQIETNPYDKLASSIRDFGTEVLKVINAVILPLLNLITEVPVLGLVPALGVLSASLSKILPNLDGFIQKSEDIQETLELRKESVSGLLDLAVEDIKDPTATLEEQAQIRKEITRLSSVEFGLEEQISLEQRRRKITELFREDVKKRGLITATKELILNQSNLAIEKTRLGVAQKLSIVERLRIVGSNISGALSLATTALTGIFVVITVVTAAIAGAIALFKKFFPPTESQEKIKKVKEELKDLTKTAREAKEQLNDLSVGEGLEAVAKSSLAIIENLEEQLKLEKAIKEEVKKQNFERSKNVVTEIAAIAIAGGAGRQANELFKNAQKARKKELEGIDELIDSVKILDPAQAAIAEKAVREGKSRENILKILSASIPKLEALSQLNENLVESSKNIREEWNKLGLKELNTGFTKINEEIQNIAKAARQLQNLGTLDDRARVAFLENLDAESLRGLVALSASLNLNIDEESTNTIKQFIEDLERRETIDLEIKTFFAPNANNTIQDFFRLGASYSKIQKELLADTEQVIEGSATIGNIVEKSLVDLQIRAKILQIETQINSTNLQINEKLLEIDRKREDAKKSILTFTTKEDKLISNIENTTRSLQDINIARQKAANDIAALEQTSADLAFAKAAEERKGEEANKDIIATIDAQILRNKELKEIKESLYRTELRAAQESANILAESLVAESKVRQVMADQNLILDDSIDSQYIRLEAENRLLKLSEERLALLKEEAGLAAEIADKNLALERARAEGRAARQGRGLTTGEEREFARRGIQNQIDAIKEQERLLELEKDALLNKIKLEQKILMLQLNTAELNLKNAINAAAPGTDTTRQQQALASIPGLRRDIAKSLAEQAKAQASIFGQRAESLSLDRQIAEENLANIPKNFSQVISREFNKVANSIQESFAAFGLSGQAREGFLAERQTILQGSGTKAEKEESLKILKKQSFELQQQQTLAEGLNNVFNTVQESISGAFMSLVDGSKSAKQAFGDMAKAILASIAQMIIQMLVLKSIQAIGLPIPFANGGIMPASPPTPLANGGIMSRSSGLQGIVSQPTYLVGEGRYNEAVVPLPNGRAIPVQMHGNSGSTNNVQVNVNMTSSGTQTQTEGVDQAKLGQAVAAAVQRELVAQRAPGGLLNRYSAI
jgi:hypothetical protein